MRVQLTISILLVFALLAMLGCSTKNVGNNIMPGREASGFNLDVMDDSFFDGASVQDFRLETTDYGEDVVISIHVEGASGLKALFFDLSYDPEIYRPLLAEPAQDLENRDDMLTLSVLRERGEVHYGQVLEHPDWRTGFTGNGPVAEVLFRKATTPALRALSSVSTFDRSAPLASLAGTDVNWFHSLQGDYDQNGETNGADLVPIALNIGEVGPFADNSVEVLVDGDGNGEINSSDITPIGLNFGHDVLGGWNVYHSLDVADYPESNTDDNGAATLLGNTAFNTATGGYPTDRKAFTADGSGAPANSFFWVRGTDGSGEGTPSNWVGGDESDFPVLALTNPPAGGDGTSGNPYVADTVTDYIFSLTDPTDGDVSTDAGTTYSLSDPAAGSIAGGSSTLNIEDAYTGTFNVTAMYNGTPNRSDTTIHITVGGGPGGNVDIYPDPADTDWGGVAGDGTSGSPYIVHDAGAFNDDFLTEFSLLADDDTATAGPSGNNIPVGDLTWAINPPFLVTWISPGTFAANIFTSNYIFAQDAGLNESNHLYVVSQSLPE